MSQTSKKSKRGRKPKYGFDNLAKPGEYMDIMPDKGTYFTPADAKRIATAVWSHRLKHILTPARRVLTCRSVFDQKGNIIAVRVIQI